MTQQYLCGELSIQLARLQALAARCPWLAGQIGRLRAEAEIAPPATLGSVAARGIAVGDELCWQLLGDGDLTTFSCLAAECSELYEFAWAARFGERSG
jgi:hypothetical protein